MVLPLSFGSRVAHSFLCSEGPQLLKTCQCGQEQGELQGSQGAIAQWSLMLFKRGCCIALLTADRFQPYPEGYFVLVNRGTFPKLWGLWAKL